MASDDELIAGCGLTENKIKEFAKSEKLKSDFLALIRVAPKEGALLFTVAQKLKKVAPPAESLHLLAKRVGDGAIDKIRIDMAIDCLLKSVKAGQPLTQEHLDKECGVGETVSPAQIEAAVTECIEQNRAELVEKRYWFPSAKLIPVVLKKLKWVLPADVRTELEKQVLALLGPKTEADSVRPEKPKKAAGGKGAEGGGSNAPKGKKGGGQLDPNRRKGDGAAAAAGGEADADDGDLELPPPTANLTGNKPDVWAEHLKITGGNVVTRFPPEPNGYLHVGHAKAMHMDFGLATKAGPDSTVYLRFDDTNPEAESHEFIDAIQNTVAWLGHKPTKVTYSSDYFDQLFDFGVQLIRDDKAFVCHMKRDEMQTARRAGQPSPWRNRPIAESEKLFMDMKRGKFAEGEAMLRLKIDHQHINHVMRDPVAFRIKFWPHPRTGDKWCVYPSYDFTHCIVDSLEHISHSLCTLEFDIRRESYYWLLDALNLYKPLVWEFSRLTLVDDWLDPRTGEVKWLATSLSKRRLKRMVELGIARGWDDPRMPTLVGLRRRGFTAAALTNFCEAIGISRSQQRAAFGRVEGALRLDLDKHASRAFAVLRPLTVTITNWDQLVADGLVQPVEAPLNPHQPEAGQRQLPISAKLLMEQTDFRWQDDKSYYGMAPGKEVLLRYASILLRVDEAVKQPGADDQAPPVELKCSARLLSTVLAADPKFKKPKGVLHWLDAATAVKVEMRLYEWLFCTVLPKPAAAGTGGDDDATDAGASAAAALDADAGAHDDDDDDGGAGGGEGGAEPVHDAYPCTEEVLTNCFVEPSAINADGTVTVEKAFQFERQGFFVVDKDSKSGGPYVFNRSVTLKESREKLALLKAANNPKPPAAGNKKKGGKGKKK